MAGRARQIFEPHPTLVSEVRPAKKCRIAIENFAPSAAERSADAVPVAREGVGLQTTRTGDDLRHSAEMKYRIGAIVADRPLKTVRLAVALMQCRFEA